ncbi:MAG: alpha/beta fold hydrolase [Acidobacteriaceae bacterium]
MTGISNRLQTLSIPGPAGSIEALLVEGQAEARYAALVCHPHPKGGGTMHNKVVYRAAKTMQALGLATLRFNFRGTGLSEGEHDEGRGEQDDVRAALDWLHTRYGLPVLVVGFSFGAYVSLRACCRDATVPGSDANIPGFAALGLPVAAEGRGYSYDFLASCTMPKIFISGGADQYGPQASLVRIVASAAQPATLVIVPEADHFFAGKLEQMQHALRDWFVSRFFTGVFADADSSGPPAP